jgi:hypothetical protein
VNDITFALPSGYDWDITKFKKEVKTKAWVKKHQNKLHHWVDKLTNANCDPVQIIGGMLQTAYGVNIGRQIEESLGSEDFILIKENIFSIMVW